MIKMVLTLSWRYALRWKSKGVNTMSFEAFSNEDIQKIVNHTLECMSKENI